MWLVFYMWLVVAAVCDAIYRKCYNWLVITGVFMAFVAVISVPESLPVPINLQDRLIGMLFGFFVFLLFYIFKMMGAGDVKFAAALGAWLGWQILLPIWVVSCAFAVMHGVIVKYGVFVFPGLRYTGSEFHSGKKKIYSLCDLPKSGYSHCDGIL